MTTTELRIGNYIDYGQGREPQTINGHDLYEGIEERPFRPILLTEEWIEKFHFTLVQHDFKFYTRRIDRGDCNVFSIRLWENKGWNFGLYQHDGGFDIPVRFVHELQNLYFALTAEELTIKS